MKKTILKITALFVLYSSVFACCTDRNIVEVDTDTEACEGRYRANITGKWQLLQIIVWHITNKEGTTLLDTVDVSRQNVIYEFLANNQLIITGNIDDEFAAGKHTYQYSLPPRDTPYSVSYGHNFSIDDIRMSCNALCNQKQMSIAKSVDMPSVRMNKIRQFFKLE